jgi:predicted TIM-barrel fold metal-dependent hydrolase
MNEVGIWAQIMYPNVVGFGGQKFAKIADVELRNLCCTIWNDAMIEMKEQSDGRLNGMATLPWWDIERSVTEAERVKRLGLKGVNISADPQVDGTSRDLSDAMWNPLWEACESLGLPVNFHVGASQTQTSWFGDASWPSFNDKTKLALGSAVLYLGNARVVGNLIYAGILERYPALKFVSVESGIGWMPFFLHALDYQAVECDVDHLSMKPSDYFKRQVYGCFWFENSDLVADVERVGWDKCMFETDFPHPTCLYPDPLTDIGRALESVPFELRRKVLSGNAAHVYNIDVPAPAAG